MGSFTRRAMLMYLGLRSGPVDMGPGLRIIRSQATVVRRLCLLCHLPDPRGGRPEPGDGDAGSILHGIFRVRSARHHGRSSGRHIQHR